MGNKCFRPSLENNQPVYLSALDNAIKEAERFVNSQGGIQNSKEMLERIFKNQQRKGNIKKLFDYLQSHQRNINKSIIRCQRQISHNKDLATSAIGVMFLQKLLKFIQKKKQNQNKSQKRNLIVLKSNLKDSGYDYRNLIQQIQCHFFELVISIIVHSQNNQLKQKVSEVLISYTFECQEKIIAKRQVKNVLDVYLIQVFEKNVLEINRNSYIHFYAYSQLLAKSKGEFMRVQFVEKHFNFILRLFFEIEDCKNIKESVIKVENFVVFEECVNSIVKEFIIFSLENRKLKDYILNDLMAELDSENFQLCKIQKVQSIISQSLNQMDMHHIMFDWFGKILSYLAIRPEVENRDSLSLNESIQDIKNNRTISRFKNINETENKLRVLQSIQRWFNEKYLNEEKTILYYSQNLIDSLMINFSKQGHSQANGKIYRKTKELFLYFLQERKINISKIYLFLNQRLRKIKNIVLFSAENSQIKVRKTSSTHQIQLQKEQWNRKSWTVMEQFLSQNQDARFFINSFKKQEIQALYEPISRQLNFSANIIFILRLVTHGLKGINADLTQDYQQTMLMFLISVYNVVCLPYQGFQRQFLSQFIPALKAFLSKLTSNFQSVIVTFFGKINERNLVDEVTLKEIPLMQVVFEMLLSFVKHEKDKNGNLKKLQQIYKQLVELSKPNPHQKKINQKQIKELYKKAKPYFINVKDTHSLFCCNNNLNKIPKDVPRNLRELGLKDSNKGENSAVDSSQFEVSKNSQLFGNQFKIVMETLRNN